MSATALGNPMADFQRGCREGQWSGEANADAVSRAIVEQAWRRLQGDG